jgi:hypothetical protein
MLDGKVFTDFIVIMESFLCVWESQHLALKEKHINYFQTVANCNLKLVSSRLLFRASFLKRSLPFYPEYNSVSTIRIFNLKCPKSQALNDFL